MKIILSSAFSGSRIRDQLGRPDYSYYFVMAGMRPALERLGEVVTVDEPEWEVDAILDAMPAGEPCVFVCVAPPHRVPSGLRCPTVPLFAWEFDSLPDEQLDDDPRSDWRTVFAEHGRAITLSRHSARLVSRSMGASFPVAAIPVPVWDQYSRLYRVGGDAFHRHPMTLRWRGNVMDSTDDTRLCEMPAWPPLPPPARPVLAPEAVVIQPGPEPEPEPEPEPQPAPEIPAVSLPARPGVRARLSMSKHLGLEWYRLVLRDLLPPPARKLNSLAGRVAYRSYRAVLPARTPVAHPEPVPPVEPVAVVSLPAIPPLPAVLPPALLPLPECALTLGGIVYATLLNPEDGRKNWFDIVTAFCWALREFDDATLVIKMVHHEEAVWRPKLDLLLTRMAPFRCRVVVVQGFLETEQLEALIGATSFYVNASSGEGLCMPLMEFMSAGKPAIAPSHTAMEDYVAADCAFIVDSSQEQNVWPHDPRDLFRTTRHRIDWHSLMQAYLDSHAVARSDPSRYAAMSARATAAMSDFCSMAVVEGRLSEMLQPVLARAGVAA